jgi:hypothetical protein
MFRKKIEIDKKMLKHRCYRLAEYYHSCKDKDQRMIIEKYIKLAVRRLYPLFGDPNTQLYIHEKRFKFKDDLGML